MNSAICCRITGELRITVSCGSTPNESFGGGSVIGGGSVPRTSAGSELPRPCLSFAFFGLAIFVRSSA